MENSFATMSVLTKFLHLKHILFSKKIKEIDPSLSKPQAGIIIHMLPSKSYRVGELAKMLEVTPGAITHASRILINKGYLLRTHGEDLRTVYLQLSEKGEKLRGKIMNCLEKINQELLGFLNEKEKEEFVRLLGKITENLERIAEENGK